MRWHRAGFRRYWRWKSQKSSFRNIPGVRSLQRWSHLQRRSTAAPARRGCSSGWIIQKGELRSGSYATVLLNLASDAQLLSIPASALILDQEGLRVAVVDQGDRVHFKRVAIAHDLGKEGRDSDWAHRDSSSDHDTARRYRRRRPSENRGRSHQAGAGNGRTTILAEGSVRPRFSDAVTLGKRCAGGGDRRYLAFASTGQN